MRIRHIRTLDELDAIEKHWRDLECIDGGPSLFQSWTWNRIWCDQVLSTRKRARLDVRVIEDGAGRILAILPFFEEDLAGPLVRVMQFLGHRMSEYNDVLLADPRSSELAEQVVQALPSGLGPRTVLHLRHLNGQSEFTKQLVTQRLAEPQCAYLWLQADPMITDQGMRLGRSKRKTFRWAMNYLHRHFEAEFQVQAGEDFLPAFDELVDLHHRRFSSKGRSTSLVGSTLAFWRIATSTLCNTGIFEIVQLRAGGRTIAAALLAHDKQHYFLLNIGFDPEFGRFSPMRLLLTETMRRGFEDLGCEIYDLGAGYGQYKFDWSPIVGTNYMCCRGGTGPYAKLMATLYGIAFRRRIASTT